MTSSVPGVGDKYQTHVQRVSGEMLLRLREDGREYRNQPFTEGLPGSMRKHVAHAFKVPSLTLELPFDKTLQTNFFVTDGEIGGVYAGMRLAALTLIDWATGPPHVALVEIKRGEAVKYRGRLLPTSPTARELTVEVDEKFTETGDYQVKIQFNRPRHAVGKGDSTPPDPGVFWGSFDNPETEAVVKGDGWMKTVWRNDTWFGIMKFEEEDLDVPVVGLPGGGLGKLGRAVKYRLSVSLSDTFGNKLDGDPETVVKWDGQWVQYEDEAHSAADELGGKDWNHSFGGGQ